MRLAVFLLLVCSAADLVACAVLLGFAWAQYRRLRKEAATSGEILPSATKQFGCLILVGLLGFAGVYGCVAWLLKRDSG